MGHLTGWRCRGYLRGVMTRFEALAASSGLLLALQLTASVSAAQSAPNSDQLLVQIATLEKPPGQATVLKQPLDAAKNGLARARDARAAGDLEHGIELETLALDYITIARDLLRAADIEAALRKAQIAYTESETARRRTETLLEATVGQRERTKAQLMQALAERDAKKAAGPVKSEPKKTNKAVKK